MEAAREGITRCGFVVHEAAERVLAAFDGLTFKDFRGFELRMDGVALARVFEEDELPYLRRLHAAPLCPVGRSANAGLYYFVVADGTWVMLHEGWGVVYVVDSLEDVFRFALLNENPPSLVGRRLSVDEYPEGY
jgi:hypothetical protein